MQITFTIEQIEIGYLYVVNEILFFNSNNFLNDYYTLILCKIIQQTLNYYACVVYLIEAYLRDNNNSNLILSLMLLESVKLKPDTERQAITWIVY